MKWNGTVSQSGHRSIAYRFASENSTHAMSHQRKRFGHSNAVRLHRSGIPHLER